MRNKDVIAGTLLLLFGVIVLLMIPSQIEEVNSVAVGPRGFPYFCAILLIICSAALCLKGYFDGKKENSKDAPENEKKTSLPAFGFYLTTVVYAVVMHYIGYLISSFIFLPIMLYMLGVRKKLLYLILIPIVLGVYFLFQSYLHVQLP